MRAVMIGLLVLLGGCAHLATLPSKPEVSITAQELWQAYQHNEVGA
jgi:hypothetical protein